LTITITDYQAEEYSSDEAGKQLQAVIKNYLDKSKKVSVPKL